MDTEKQCLSEAATRSHLRSPVCSRASRCVFRPTTHFTPCSFVSHVDVISLSCQVSLDPLRFFVIFIVVSKETSNWKVAARIPIPPSSSAVSFSSSRHQEVISRSVSRRCLSFLLPVRGLSFSGLTTFAWKSRAVAIDFDVTSYRASVSLVPRSCVIALTRPANSHASSRRPRTKDSAGHRVPLSCLSAQYDNFSLTESLLCSHSVLSRVV